MPDFSLKCWRIFFWEEDNCSSIVSTRRKILERLPRTFFCLFIFIQYNFKEIYSRPITTSDSLRCLVKLLYLYYFLMSKASQHLIVWVGFFSLTEDKSDHLWLFLVWSEVLGDSFNFLSKLSIFQIKNSKQRHFKLENRLRVFTCMWKAFIYKPCHYFWQWYSFSWKTPPLQGKKKKF